MELGKFLNGVEEASYLLHVNEGNNFFVKGGHGNVTIGGNTVIVGDISANADLECSVDEPVLAYTMQDGFSRYARTGHFEVEHIAVDVTYTFVSNKCQCANCNA